LLVAKYVKSWNTINGMTIWRALHTPGGAVHDWAEDIAKATMEYAIALSPVNNPLNARRPGHAKPGVYKASWKKDRRGSNQSATRRRVYNTADHAMIVEKGRRYTRKRQVFSWSEARGPGTYYPKYGTWKPGPPRPGGKVSTPVTHARSGQRVLERATRAAATEYGVRRSLRIY
jgi:hypothetical protein